MTYTTPLRDIYFSLMHVADFAALEKTGAYEDMSSELVEAVLEEAGKLADQVVAPLNWPSDQQGAKLENGEVAASPGFKEAYAQYVAGGWNALAFSPEFGGQGLPTTLQLAVSDALFAACLSFAMGTCLTTGAVKALLAHGSAWQKRVIVPKMVSGEWMGTMNLTEAHAGSDLSMLRTKAEPLGEGHYAITGSKIYISYGDHDLSANICHLVLARLPDAPEGTKGVSMFLVPKYLVREDGSLGAYNNVQCTGLEHKLGQHGSPTCSLRFGEGGSCIGTLVGNENEGLKNMFVMMNAARIDVGTQGVSVAERAYQRALAFAQERRQGRREADDPEMVPIIQHPDVRRNLLMMKALTQAGRGICYANMVAHDLAKTATDAATRQKAKEREELLTPIAKAFGSDRGSEVTHIGVQVHGGMGFVEEAGAAQHMRDIRICSIYEGTNGIQAIDLVGRKLGMANGRVAHDFLAEVMQLTTALQTHQEDASFAMMADGLARAVSDLQDTTDFMIAARGSDDSLAGATPYLNQFGYVAGGFYLAKGALNAVQQIKAAAPDAAYLRSHVQLAGFYVGNILPRAQGLVSAVRAGADCLKMTDLTLWTG